MPASRRSGHANSCLVQSLRESQRLALTAAKDPYRGKSNALIRGTAGCLTCRIRRKQCSNKRSGVSLPENPCDECVRLKLECLGWMKGRPDWLKEPGMLEIVRSAITRFSFESRSNGALPPFDFGPFYRGSDFEAPFPVSTQIFPSRPAPMRLDIEAIDSISSSSFSSALAWSATPDSPYSTGELESSVTSPRLPRILLPASFDGQTASALVVADAGRGFHAPVAPFIHDEHSYSAPSTTSFATSSIAFPQHGCPPTQQYMTGSADSFNVVLHPSWPPFENALCDSEGYLLPFEPVAGYLPFRYGAVEQLSMATEDSGFLV